MSPPTVTGSLRPDHVYLDSYYSQSGSGAILSVARELAQRSFWYHPATGRWAATFCHEQLLNKGQSDLERLWTEHNQATDNTTYGEGEYLEVIATKN